ncbi:hypothetical protein MMC06_003308 [Schaereria dolodes]|nr:hypothetical protein [Schaereria dolodes]
MTIPLWKNSSLQADVSSNVGARAQIFQLPSTPSTSNLLHTSTDSLSKQETSIGSRKRARHGHSLSAQSVSYTTYANGWSNLKSNPSSVVSTPGIVSPTPFVNTQYRLAGGLDTPTAAAASAYESNYGDAAEDIAYRRGRGWSIGGSAGSGSYFPHIPLALSREGNGQRRSNRSLARQDGWSKTVYSVVGGVAGKVWEFCKAGAFRGFYAGGGQGYSNKAHLRRSDASRSNIWQDVEKEHDIFDNTDRATTTIPGEFPPEDFILDYMSEDHTNVPSRPSKKVHLNNGEGDLRTSWVLVSNSAHTSRQTSPTRVSTRKLPRASSPSHRPTSSKAGRRPILPASRPSLTSYAGSAALRPNRPASTASTRSPVTTPMDEESESPLSVDAKRYAARVKRKEYEEDQNMRKLNQQLKAMIREGKEALGTKVEIDLDWGREEILDEGYAEGEDFEEVGRKR